MAYVGFSIRGYAAHIHLYDGAARGELLFLAAKGVVQLQDLSS